MLAVRNMLSLLTHWCEIDNVFNKLDNVLLIGCNVARLKIFCHYGESNHRPKLILIIQVMVVCT